MRKTIRQNLQNNPCGRIRIAYDAAMKTKFSVMLANSYQGEDPSGWWISEKLDGVRALWDGERLLSRNGNPFPAPAAWLARLPRLPLDGELWLGRGKFQATLSAIKRGDFSAIRFRVFDAPAHPGTFAARYQLAAMAPGTDPLPHYPCTGRRHLENYLAEILAAGGEGVMLRNPAAPHAAGRSAGLLKYKPYDDAEGVMVRTEAGAGKYKGQVGALVIRWAGRLVKVGSGLSDETRLFPPAAGALVTFRHCGFTDSGSPRFPTFQAVRNYE